jgi:hypothetical protein
MGRVAGLPLRLVCAAVAVASIGAAMCAVSPDPAGASLPSGSVIAVPSAGPVGTVVHVTGQLTPACRPGWRTVDVTLERLGQPLVGGVESVWAPVGVDGRFSLEYRIPADLGGSATRGLIAWPVTSGTYQFQFTTGGSCGISDPGLFRVSGSAAPSAASYVGLASTPDGKGYWLAQADGGVSCFGDASSFGSLPGIGVHPSWPIVGLASTPDGKGYWLVGADGGVFAFGDAGFFGSLPSAHITPNGPIVSITATMDGKGYWLLGVDGGVFAFGDAVYQGRQTASEAPYESIAALAGGGYAVAAASPGQLWDEPADARLSTVAFFATFPVAASVSGAAVTATGDGGWQVGLDGGVFAFGKAPFEGSLPGIGVTPNAPIVAITRTPDGNGYWLLGSDGGVFAFGDAGFYGSDS